MDQPTRFPTVSIYPEAFARAQRQTEVAFASIQAEHPWLQKVAQRAFQLSHENASVRSKLRKVQKIADQINAAITPAAQCREGCSSCCNIGVTIYRAEAEAIGQAIGRRPAMNVGTSFQALNPEAIARKQYFGFGTPCPFLANNRCAIYEHRPLACRLHANLGDVFFCNTEVSPEDSVISNIDLTEFNVAVALLFIHEPIADIREFFPPSA